MKREYSFKTGRMSCSESDIRSAVGPDKMLVHKEPENATVHCCKIFCMCGEYIEWNTWNDVWARYVVQAHSQRYTFQGFESVHKDREDTEFHTCSGWLKVTSNPELLDKVCHLQAK